MRINGPNGTGTVSGNKTARRTGAAGSAFQLPSEGGAASASTPTSQTSAVQDVGALLALQSVDDALSGRKRKALRRGNKMLDLLDDVRLGLLSGALPLHILHQLESLSQQIESSGDERIDAVLSEIELRAQVEIAKLARQNAGH
ncbi:MAG: flagellar assembly protein FliX [Cohaesibacter sp.]|nr:flagellar assembly protein FliX [Cohaesibacter sp.]